MQKELLQIEKRLARIIENHNNDTGVFLNEARSLMDRRDMILRIMSGSKNE